MVAVADDYLQSAKTLSTGGLEIDRRNSISRAYYAAYHAVLGSGINANCPDADSGMAGGVHQQLIARLIASDAGTPARKVGVKLQLARQRRVRADYKLCEDIEGRDTAMQLALAWEIFTICNASADGEHSVG